MARKKVTTTAQSTEIKLIPQDGAEFLISRAIDKGLSVEGLERLLAMRRELEAEKAKKAYDYAMANFQASCPTIVKTKEVHTNTGALAYKYAPIESIVSQVKNNLKENGFSYSTSMELLSDGVRVSLKVTHIGGHSEVTEMTVPFGTKTGIMSNSQVVAAAQTFAKRYAFCNAFGILTGDEDTDGAHTNNKEEKEEAAKHPIPLISKQQRNHIIQLLSQKGKSLLDLDAAVSIFGVDSYQKLTVPQAGKLIQKLESLPDKVVEEPFVDIDEVAEKIEEEKLTNDGR
jgi:hypothetical protein